MTRAWSFFADLREQRLVITGRDARGLTVGTYFDAITPLAEDLLDRIEAAGASSDLRLNRKPLPGEFDLWFDLEGPEGWARFMLAFGAAHSGAMVVPDGLSFCWIRLAHCEGEVDTAAASVDQALAGWPAASSARGWATWDELALEAYSRR